MPNDIFNQILDRKIESFASVFLDDSEAIFKIDGKLFHPQEFGTYRERVVSEIISSVIPQNIDVKDGFVITANNNVSTQCDIIIFDKNKTPIINDGVLRFFPIEAVYAIGEVKSIIRSKGELTEILTKLSNQKALEKDTVGVESGELLTTFLVCKKLDFDFLPDFEDHYQNIDNNEFRHNFILSLEDGLISYQIERGSLSEANQNAFDNVLKQSKLWYYPTLGIDLLPTVFSEAKEYDKFIHIKMFLHAISSSLETVRKPHLELQKYYLK